MTSNKLSKEQQKTRGQGAIQKGDWCELIAAAYFRRKGYLIFIKMSGPIDLILVHGETGETRYIDVKYKNTRQGTKTKGSRINRTVTSVLKNFLKIEIIYVDEKGEIEKAYEDGRERWHKQFKVNRNSNGQYNGKIEERENK